MQKGKSDKSHLCDVFSHDEETYIKEMFRRLKSELCWFKSKSAMERVINQYIQNVNDRRVEGIVSEEAYKKFIKDARALK